MEDIVEVSPRFVDVPEKISDPLLPNSDTARKGIVTTIYENRILILIIVVVVILIVVASMMMKSSEPKQPSEPTGIKQQLTSPKIKQEKIVVSTTQEDDDTPEVTNEPVQKSKETFNDKNLLTTSMVADDPIQCKKSQEDTQEEDTQEEDTQEDTQENTNSEETVEQKICGAITNAGSPCKIRTKNGEKCARHS